jgi:5-methylcytosine-specific restriction protein B
MKFCKNAAKLGEQPCVFVIDEINRADLSRVFGELFFALESDYRGKPVETQYASLREANEEKHFSVPKNVFIIGTMNDIDRSVESIDFALRRRFAWYEVRATEDRFDAVIQRDLDGTIKEKAKERYTSLNKKIEETEGLNHSYQIGPAYYRKLKKYASTDQVWQFFWQHHLELLLREYVRGWPKLKADKQISEFRAAYDLKPEDQHQQ